MGIFLRCLSIFVQKESIMQKIHKFTKTCNGLCCFLQLLAYLLENLINVSVIFGNFQFFDDIDNDN